MAFKNMNVFKTTKGLDIPLTGKPANDLVDCSLSSTAVIYPLEFAGIRQRIKVQVGDSVKRGAELLEDKRNENFKLRAPVGGTISEIKRGARRFVEQIVIDADHELDPEQFQKYSQEEILSLDRSTVMKQLVTTGYSAFIEQRPFSKIADPEIEPKSIFVNAMNTAPFSVDAGVVIKDDPDSFQAGLNLMTRLTSGSVYLCVPKDSGAEFTGVKNVDVNAFSGPHPSGNSSFHISKLDPMSPSDTVWTVKAADLVLIGRLFLDGVLPESRIISLGGSGLENDGCRHYRVSMGGSLAPLFDKFLTNPQNRIIYGSVLAGRSISSDAHLGLGQSSVTVIPEDRERHFLGWTMPGFNQFSYSRLVASSWLPWKKKWNLATNRHGDPRAMVLTGHYDKVMPLNIMVDYLIRAVLAGDTDEAIRLGILETAPEDFALCDFICPSKIEVQGIIKNGLEMIEEEGI